MYAAMALISILVRQYILPNPFECFGDMAILYNWIAGVILVPLSYFLVGQVYWRGESPSLGSFLFLMVYAILTGVLWLLGQFSFAWWAIASVIALIACVWSLLSRNRGDFY